MLFTKKNHFIPKNYMIFFDLFDTKLQKTKTKINTIRFDFTTRVLMRKKGKFEKKTQGVVSNRISSV